MEPCCKQEVNVVFKKRSPASISSARSRTGSTSSFLKESKNRDRIANENGKFRKMHFFSPENIRRDACRYLYFQKKLENVSRETFY